MYNDAGGTSRADMGVWGGPYSNMLFLFPSDPHLFVSSSTVNFGNAVVGVPDTAWLPLQNRGVGDVILDSAIAAPVAIIEFPDTIAPFANDTIGLVWTPQAAGDLNASLLIYHNDANISWPFTVVLQGSAALDADANPSLAYEFRLEQNYPNPFNPATELKFSLSRGGFASIKIYDASGRQVSELVHQNLPAGNHAVSFVGSHLASGIYFYTLSSADGVQTRKMLLLK
jgi:hypothetical protein